jgi:hypothetical protein
VRVNNSKLRLPGTQALLVKVVSRKPRDCNQQEGRGVMFMRFDIFILGYRKLDMKMENIGSATSGSSRPRNPLWGTGQEGRGVGHVRG